MHSLANSCVLFTEVKTFAFMEPKSSPTYSQKLATGFCPQTDHSSSHLHRKLPHSATTQKTVIFVLATMRTSNLTSPRYILTLFSNLRLVYQGIFLPQMLHITPIPTFISPQHSYIMSNNYEAPHICGYFLHTPVTSFFFQPILPSAPSKIPSTCVCPFKWDTNFNNSIRKQN
jgi:hypothetical protein